MATKARRLKFKINDRVTIASYTPLVPAYGGKPFVGRSTVLRVSSVTGKGTLRSPCYVHVTDDDGHFWLFPQNAVVTAPEAPEESVAHARKSGAQLDSEIAHALRRKKRSTPRTVHVEAATPAGYRWLRQNARGATLTADGFLITNETEWARSLEVAGAKEI